MKTITNKPFPFFSKKNSIARDQFYSTALVRQQTKGLKIISISFN